MNEPLLPNFYDVGTISVENGETAFTITGGSPGAWLGDMLFLPSQPLIPPQRISSNGELAYPWPGTTESDVPYEIRYVGIIERSTAQSRRVLEQLGDVKAWFDISVPYDAARLALDTEANPLRSGYRVLVIEDSVIWIKASGAYDDWSGPVEFRGETGNKGWSPLYALVEDGDRVVFQLAGWTGGEGDAPTDDVGRYLGAPGFVDDIEDAVDIRGLGFDLRGDYAGGTTYAKGDVVQQSGSSWVALQATTGNAPPTLPTTSNAYWQLLARQGVDGAGTVSSVAAGVGVSVNSADPTAPVVALANMANATVKGRNSSGTGAPEDVTMAQLLILLKSVGAYAKDNILGVVSQASGVPAGAIIERGSNANGEYVRFADGTQICRHEVATGSRNFAGSGTATDPYRSNIADWMFPALFASAPRLSLTSRVVYNNGARRASSAGCETISSSQATALQCFMISAFPEAGDTFVQAIAIGRWF